MKHKKAILNSIFSQGMLPLFYDEDPDVSIDVVRTLYKAGIRAVEYTNRGKHALENFRLIKKAAKKVMPELNLGVGTVKNISEAEAFADAGADFIVSPITNSEVAKAAQKHKLLWIPGCMTPTEIYAAQKHGAELIKIFPANILGPEFIRSIRDLFPGQAFIPTGGVDLTPENITGWFHAGAAAVGVGSKLITADVLENKLYEKLYNDTVMALEIVKAVM